MKVKEDFNPLFIYFGIMILLQVCLSMILPSFVPEDYLTAVSFIVLYTIMFGTFIAVYWKKVLEDLKKLSWKTILIIVGISAAMFFAIEFLASLLPKAANEESIIDIIHQCGIWTLLPISLFGPFAEEMVFRYSFSTFIKKDTIFLIVSSLVFAAMHMSSIGIEMIVYVIMGLFLGLVYLKTYKNIAASTIAHVVNNFIEVIMLLFL